MKWAKRNSTRNAMYRPNVDPSVLNLQSKHVTKLQHEYTLCLKMSILCLHITLT